MNLDLFKDLINSAKENNLVQGFIKELGEALENNERNETTILDKILNGRNLTASYRDEINTEKVNILRSCAKETADKGKLYYIYSKSSNKDNIYRVGVYGKNMQDEVEIKIEESKLPRKAGVDSILRLKNGEYILDEEVTKQVQEELTEMINKLLEEQTKTLAGQRIEGHLYEFVEKGKNKVWLIDKTSYTGECIEEFNLPQELFDKANKGDVFQYVNGEYQVYSNNK